VWRDIQVKENSVKSVLRGLKRSMTAKKLAVSLTITHIRKKKMWLKVETEQGSAASRQRRRFLWGRKNKDLY